MTRVVLHIDRLVLRGIDRHDAGAVAAGVQAELARLLARDGAADALPRDTARIRVGSVRVGRASGAVLGADVAGGIARGLSR